jgi:hypothetical protein
MERVADHLTKLVAPRGDAVIPADLDGQLYLYFFILLDASWMKDSVDRPTPSLPSDRACRTPPKRTPQAIRSYQTVEANRPKGFALIGGAVEAKQIAEQLSCC